MFQKSWRGKACDCACTRICIANFAISENINKDYIFVQNF